MKTDNEKVQNAFKPSAAATRKFWDRLTDGMPDVILRWDHNQNLTYASRRLEQLTVSSRDSLYNKGLNDFDVFTGSSKVWRKAFSKCAITGKSITLTKVYNCPVFGKLVFEMQISPNYNEEKILKGYTAICRDITDKISKRSRLDRLSTRHEMIFELSQNFISVGSNQTNYLINNSLERIGNLLGADRAYVFSYDLPADTSSNTHEWCRSGIAPQIEELQEIPLGQFPEFLRRHIDGLPYVVRETRNLNPGAAATKLFLQQGIKTLVAVPVMAGSRCIGFTGIDFVEKSTEIDTEEIELLEQFARLLYSLHQKP
jgi:PAS domain S-box-containing protein